MSKMVCRSGLILVSIIKYGFLIKFNQIRTERRKKAELDKKDQGGQQSLPTPRLFVLLGLGELSPRVEPLLHCELPVPTAQRFLCLKESTCQRKPTRRSRVIIIAWLATTKGNRGSYHI